GEANTPLGSEFGIEGAPIGVDVARQDGRVAPPRLWVGGVAAIIDVHRVGIVVWAAPGPVAACHVGVTVNVGGPSAVDRGVEEVAAIAERVVRAADRDRLDLLDGDRKSAG